MTELGITIGGQSFPHLLYHFVLAYSNWEDATVTPCSVMVERLAARV